MSTPSSAQNAQALENVHEFSDKYVAEYVALDPLWATHIGVPGYEREMTDYSPEGHEARAECNAKALRLIAAIDPRNASEQNAKAVFCERVGLEQEIHEAGLDRAALNVIVSPVQEVREIFEIMSTESPEQWENIAARLRKVPSALTGIRTSLTKAAAEGQVSALRQVSKVAEQVSNWAGQKNGQSFFDTLIAKARRVPQVSDLLQAELADAAKIAAQGCIEFSTFLREELAPLAPRKDAVGAEIYQLNSRRFLGARLDLSEAYHWGWQEFFRIETEMKRIANRIKPGASLAEAAAHLDADSQYRIHSQEEFRRWMKHLSGKALDDLNGVHFDIPDPLTTLECNITTEGGRESVYYIQPTADFSRPGTMWWSTAADREEFSTWRETTTVYHEGVPGHHLQVGTALCQADQLNQFQRLLCWVSGHGEGWALYAERLMQELGYLDKDGDLFGMLDAQLFRAARVIIDIGMHLELIIPKGTGFHEGERWTPELGLEFMLTRTIGQRSLIHDEIDRYLGWPGQAPSYKLGERLWLAARDEARAKRGNAFDLKEFHKQALEMGSMGLDTLRERLSEL